MSEQLQWQENVSKEGGKGVRQGAKIIPERRSGFIIYNEDPSSHDKNIE
jgi:hypothetical protein